MLYTNLPSHLSLPPPLRILTRLRPCCRCTIHWCGTSHWNTQLPMSWVRPDRQTLTRPSTHSHMTSEGYTLNIPIDFETVHCTATIF